MPTNIKAATSTNGVVIDPATGDGVVNIYTGATAGSQVLAASFAADGTPTFLNTPRATGSILQMLITADAGSSTTSTSMANLTAVIQNITPKSANSRIIVESTFTAGIGSLAAVNTLGTFQLYDSTNAALIGSAQVIQAPSASGGVGASGGMALRWFVNNSALTQRGFTIRGQTNNASVSASANNCVWTLTEVQN